METYSAALAGLIIVALGAGIVVAAVVAAIKYPAYWLFGLVVFVLAVSCSRADDLRFEVSVITDETNDREAADEAISIAAQIMRSQLGVELVVTYYEVNRVAEHTKVEALLDALVSHRLGNPRHIAADATLLLTRRVLSRSFEGYATIGPACSERASAIARLRTDGIDGQIVVHELLHTVGVPHDADAGWLMSQSISRTGSGTLSPDSVQTFKAAPSDCLTTKIEPRVVDQSGGGAPLTGGGGAFDWVSVIMMLGLAAIMWFQNEHLKACQDSEREHIEEITKLTRELISRVPSDFMLRDVSRVYTQTLANGERLVCVKFHTVAGMKDFATWVQGQANHSRVTGR